MARYNERMINQIIAESGGTKVLQRRLCPGKKQILSLYRSDGSESKNRSELTHIAKSFYEKLYTSQTSNIEGNTNINRIANVGSEDIPDITLEEVQYALKHMKNNKAPGPNGIITEAVKCGGELLQQATVQLLNRCLSEGNVPADWNTAAITLLHKKGDQKRLENYRPISLLSHLYKLFTRIINNRLSNKLDNYQPEEQAGFRKGYSTSDHLQTLKGIIERHNEYNMPLALGFVDFEKAFDTIETWAVMRGLDNCRVDSRYSQLLKAIYKNATSYIQLHEPSEKIQLKRGVRQGDTISPKLFILALEDIIKPLDWTN